MKLSLSLIAALLVVGLLSGILTPPAAALPTMIRLGYTNCAACHINPQGAGLLNPYGRGIDEAQSLRANDYEATASAPGRVTQDVRSVTQETDSTGTGKAFTGLARSRLIYRNSTDIGYGFRMTLMAAIENEVSVRPAVKYEPNITPHAMYTSDFVTLRPYLVNLMLAYRPTKNMEFEVGRDQLPSGVNIADLSFFVRQRNRQGYYDTPTQAKLFWWGKRYQVTPYLFAPGGNEQVGAGEHGGGFMGEYDVRGNGRVILGNNFLEGRTTYTNRRLIGPYARLGFGKWGILAEHDITDRRYFVTPVRQFRQNASFLQVFYAPKEWLVFSVYGERVKVGIPYAENLDAVRFEVSARLSSNFTLTAASRLQKNQINDQTAQQLIFILTVKPVL